MRTLIIAILTFFTLNSITAQDHSPEGLKQHFMAGIQAFNQHDLEEFLKQFHTDIEMYSPTGWVKGIDEVRIRFKETFRQFPKARMEIEDLNARRISENVYVVDFKWRVFPFAQGPAFHGVGTGVYIFETGIWKEILEHETVTKTDPELMRPQK